MEARQVADVVNDLGVIRLGKGRMNEYVFELPLAFTLDITEIVFVKGAQQEIQNVATQCT